MLAFPAEQLPCSCYSKEVRRGGLSPSDLSAVARSFNYSICYLNYRVGQRQGAVFSSLPISELRACSKRTRQVCSQLVFSASVKNCVRALVRFLLSWNSFSLRKFRLMHIRASRLNFFAYRTLSVRNFAFLRRQNKKRNCAGVKRLCEAGRWVLRSAQFQDRRKWTIKI